MQASAKPKLLLREVATIIFVRAPCVFIAILGPTLLFLASLELLPVSAQNRCLEYALGLVLFTPIAVAIIAAHFPPERRYMKKGLVWFLALLLLASIVWSVPYALRRFELRAFPASDFDGYIRPHKDKMALFKGTHDMFSIWEAPKDAELPGVAKIEGRKIMIVEEENGRPSGLYFSLPLPARARNPGEVSLVFLVRTNSQFHGHYVPVSKDGKLSGGGSGIDAWQEHREFFGYSWPAGELVVHKRFSGPEPPKMYDREYSGKANVADMLAWLTSF